MRKRIILLSVVATFSFTESAYAQFEIIASLEWPTATLPESTVIRQHDSEGPVLEINVNRRDIINLWSFEQPGVRNAAHAIKGRMRVQSASDNARFEMWTCFGNDEDWYSLLPIAVSDGWVDFEVSFDLGGDYTLSFPPNKILFALDLPDGGLLWISNLELVQYKN